MVSERRSANYGYIVLHTQCQLQLQLHAHESLRCGAGAQASELLGTVRRAVPSRAALQLRSSLRVRERSEARLGRVHASNVRGRGAYAYTLVTCTCVQP